MNIKLTFVDRCTIVYDEHGVIVEDISDSDGVLLPDSDNEGEKDMVGLWHKDDKRTIPWDEVVEDMWNEEFQLDPGLLFLDNGQVVDQGEIVEITITNDGGASITYSVINGGCDTSGWEHNDDNVYCISCDTSYKVEVNLDNYKPHWCCFCGGTELLLREDVVDDE